MTPIRTALTAAAAILLAASVPAQAETIYECSGLGEDQRAAAENTPHTLRLVYAQVDGHFIGGVETSVTDRAGKEILAVRCPGPWVLLNLPDGRYGITSTYEGVTKSGSVSISGGNYRRQVIRF